MKYGPMVGCSPANQQKCCQWLNVISCTDMTMHLTSTHRRAGRFPEEKAAGALTPDFDARGEQCRFPPLALLRLQSWLSPAFPTGSYSYSHGIEWAGEAGHVHDRKSLVDWLEADLCYGSGRNEAIFFIEACRCTTDDNCEKLLEIAELAAAFRGTSELALETSQQATACLAILRRVWPDLLI